MPNTLRNLLLAIFASTTLVAGSSPALAARLWTDTTGRYTLEADLIAFNDDKVVLQRADHELVAIPLDKLSDADHEYLKSREAESLARSTADDLQTWTMRDGAKVVGRIVAYGRRDMTVQRRRGRIYVNDRDFDNLPEVYQQLIPKIVAEFEQINQPDRRGLESWLVRQRGEPRTFTLEGVIVELESGDEYGVPFFFFSEEDLSVLQPGWDRWLAEHDNYAAHEDHSFLLQSLAAARHRNQQVQRQIAMMQLNLQAVQAGVTSLWEVTLHPARGNSNPPLWVVVPGRNSAQAVNAALEQNPGFIAGPVRRVAG